MAVISALSLQGCALDSNEPQTEQQPVATIAVARTVLVEKFVTLPTGVTMEYIEQGDPDGPPVIFVHGFSDSYHTWDLNLPTFPRKYHVYAISLRGHGDTTKPATGYTHADMASDVLAFMDAMGLQKASFVAASMGAFVAHYLATFNPSRVDKLVMMGTASTGVGNPRFEGALAYFSTLSDPMDPDFVRAFVMSSYIYAMPSWFMEQSVAESMKVPWRVWVKAVEALYTENHSAQLGNITAPTLILHGEFDDVFSTQQDLDMRAAIPGARLIVYRNAGHSLYAEIPIRMDCDVTRFLDGTDQSTPSPVAYYNRLGDEPLDYTNPDIRAIDNCSQLDAQPVGELDPALAVTSASLSRLTVH